LWERDGLFFRIWKAGLAEYDEVLARVYRLRSSQILRRRASASGPIS